MLWGISRTVAILLPLIAISAPLLAQYKYPDPPPPEAQQPKSVTNDPSNPTGLWANRKRHGPSFPCGANVAGQPVAQAICLNDELAYRDLAYAIAYQAARWAADDAGKRALTASARSFIQSLPGQCGLPKLSSLFLVPTPTEVRCLRDQYDSRRQELLKQLSGEALEEARLTPEQAVAIQQALQAQGLLSRDAAIDGVFGPLTRAAIVHRQRELGRRPTGFASRTMLLEKPLPQSSPHVTLPQPTKSDGHSKKTLREERMDLADKLEKQGYCGGFFDINRSAGDLLERSGTVPQAKAREFLLKLSRDRAAFKQQLPMLLAMAGVAAQSEELAQLLATAYEAGSAKGTADSDTASTADVLRWYETCQALFKPSPQQADEQQPASRSATLTATAMEAVLSQIRPCWGSPASLRDQNITVTLIVEMNPDGTTSRATVKDLSRYGRDPTFRAVADAAVRAVTNPRCQPWPLLSVDYAAWRTLTLNFDPRDY